MAAATIPRKNVPVKRREPQDDLSRRFFTTCNVGELGGETNLNCRLVVDPVHRPRSSLPVASHVSNGNLASSHGSDCDRNRKLLDVRVAPMHEAKKGGWLGKHAQCAIYDAHRAITKVIR